MVADAKMSSLRWKWKVHGLWGSWARRRSCHIRMQILQSAGIGELFSLPWKGNR